MAGSEYKMPSAGPKVAPKLSSNDVAGLEVSNRGYPGGRNLKDMVGAESLGGVSFMGPEGGAGAEVSKTLNKGSQGTDKKIPA
jgi:hypothetical protein